MANAKKASVAETTPLYPTFRKRIEDATARIIRDQVTPWTFLTAGPPFRVNQFDGREISYQGIAFEGSPRSVFWGRYIDPFLEAFALEEIEFAVTAAKERRVDASVLLREVQGLLASAVHKVLGEMADVDQRLMHGTAFEKGQARSTDEETSRLLEFIDERIHCEIQMWRPKWPIEEWYERNKFLVWLVGIIVTVGSAAAKFL
jgi:hypothetical protein